MEQLRPDEWYRDDLEAVEQRDPYPAPTHLEVSLLIEKLGRRYLDLVRVQLRDLGLEDLSAAQMILLLSIGPGEVSVNDILTRGAYIGSNTSHTLKQLVERDYLTRNSSPRDRRQARIAMSARGRQACDLFRAADRERFRAVDRERLGSTHQKLRRLEDLWETCLRFGSCLVSLCSPSLFTDVLRVSSFI